jgi:hypothetical protein
VPTIRAHIAWGFRWGLVALLITLTVFAASIGLIVPARIPQLPVRPSVVAEQVYERPD